MRESVNDGREGSGRESVAWCVVIVGSVIVANDRERRRPREEIGFASCLATRTSNLGMSPGTKAPSFSTPSELLTSFTYERVLSSGQFPPFAQFPAREFSHKTTDPRSNTICILGTALPSSTAVRAPAIIRLVKSPYSTSDVVSLLTASPSSFSKLEMVLSNAEYSTMLGWQALSAESRGADVQLFGICPATEKHVRKYSQQESRMTSETREMYEKAVKEYIEGIPVAAIEWSVSTHRLLDGEADCAWFVGSIEFSTEAPKRRT